MWSFHFTEVTIRCSYGSGILYEVDNCILGNAKYNIVHLGQCKECPFTSAGFTWIFEASHEDLCMANWTELLAVRQLNSSLASTIDEISIDCNSLYTWHKRRQLCFIFLISQWVYTKLFKRLKCRCLQNRHQKVGEINFMSADLKRCLNQYYIIWESQYSVLGGGLIIEEETVSFAQHNNAKLLSWKWKIWFITTSQCQQSWNQILQIWCGHYNIDKGLICSDVSNTHESEEDIKISHFQMEFWDLFSDFSQSRDSLSTINRTIQKLGQIQMIPC